jgi:hypothetical protein
MSIGTGLEDCSLPGSRNIFRGHAGGVRASIVEGPGVYYMGIIDVLQKYTIKKRLERWMKVLLMRDGNGACRALFVTFLILVLERSASHVRLWFFARCYRWLNGRCLYSLVWCLRHFNV